MRVHDLRDFTTDRHRVVDDMPFGGGPGMVLKPEPLFAAVEAIREQRRARRREGARSAASRDAVILTSPDGERLTHAVAARLSALDHLVVLCGRYEGVDERVREHLATEAISIGDYVLSGGELPALVIVDAVARLMPGVVGDEASVAGDTFARDGLLDFPQYTRPAEFRGHGGAAGAAVGAPRGDRAVAAAAGARAHAPAPAGFVDEALVRRKENVMTAVETVERGQLTKRPAIKPGDTVKVHVKVREGDKERIQVFEGMVIGMHRGGARATFTVRKVSFGQGVERIFPLHSPVIDKIDVLRTAKVRRAKLYFLRELKGKAARMKETGKKQTGLIWRRRIRAIWTMPISTWSSPRVPDPGECAPAHGVRVRRGRRRGRPRLPGRAGRRGGGRARSRSLHPAHLRLEDRHRARARAALRADHARGDLLVGASASSPTEIDRINIHQASLRAMQRAVLALAPLPDMVLVDAFRIPDLPMAQRGVVHGDARCTAIAAASIVAKVTRDRAMLELHGRDPALRIRSPQGLRHARSPRRRGPVRLFRRSSPIVPAAHPV